MGDMGFLKRLFGTREPAPDLPVHPDDKDLISDYDRHWWKSLTLEDCKAFEQEDNDYKLALFMKLCEESGLSEEEATEHVKKSVIRYYGTLEQRDYDPFTGDDARLPYILKDRVNIAVMKYIVTMDKNEVDSASSMNAIIRNLIRSGKV